MARAKLSTNSGSETTPWAPYDPEDISDGCLAVSAATHPGVITYVRSVGSDDAALLTGDAVSDEAST